MLTKAFLVLSGLFLAGAVQSDFYSDLSLFHELQQEPYKLNWDWGKSAVGNRRAAVDELSLEDSDEREPLARDYKDPPAASSEQKPVLVPKPKPHFKSVPEIPELPEKSSATDTPEKPERPFDGVLQDGIIDVNSDGFGGPFGAFGPDFDFSSTFGVNSKPFGLGDLFNSFQSNQWWKGKSKPKDMVDVDISIPPVDLDLHSFTSKHRRRHKEAVDVYRSSPLDLDLYSGSERNNKHRSKKIFIDWDKFDINW